MLLVEEPFRLQSPLPELNTVERKRKFQDESCQHVELQDILEAPSLDISLKTATELAVDDTYDRGDERRNNCRPKNDAIKVKDEQNKSFESSFSDLVSARKLGGQRFVDKFERFDNENEISQIEVNNDQTYDQIEEVAEQLQIKYKSANEPISAQKSLQQAPKQMAKQAPKLQVIKMQKQKLQQSNSQSHINPGFKVKL